MRKPASRPAGGVSVLGCHMRLANSRDEVTVSAAGRSLPDMSLAFALKAANNGSTGDRATLSYGLDRDQASSASARRRQRFSTVRGGGASRQRHCPAFRRLNSEHPAKGWELL